MIATSHWNLRKIRFASIMLVILSNEENKNARQNLVTNLSGQFGVDYNY